MPEKLALKLDNEATLDGLLNRRIALEQPAAGYRVAVDTVLLAASVPAHAGQRVLDLGCGAGGAMLCLAARVPRISVLGVEIQNDLRLLCRDNIVRNKLNANLCVQIGDATKLSPAMDGLFDHAMMNPPYHDDARHDVSADAKKRTAMSEKSGDLALWIANALCALKPSGFVTLIHRADRRNDILAHFTPACDMIEVINIVTKPGEAPKRVIVSAQKGTGPGILQTQQFILHQADGHYTKEADAILRDGAELG